MTNQTKKLVLVLVIVILLAVLFKIAKILPPYDLDSVFIASDDQGHLVNIPETQKSLWEGKWTDIDSTASINQMVAISNIKDTSFDFQLGAAWYAHPGEITGTALFDPRNNTASWTEDSIDSTPGKELCTVLFKKESDSITISKSGCTEYGGHNVFASQESGTFKRDFKVPQSDILGTEIFANELQKEKFIALVGDHKRDFDYSVGQCSFFIYSEVKIAQQKCWVPGVANFNTSIITTDHEDHIWAAAVDQDSVYPDIRFNYFTDIAQDKNRLPEEIKGWNSWGYKAVYQK